MIGKALPLAFYRFLQGRAKPGMQVQHPMLRFDKMPAPQPTPTPLPNPTPINAPSPRTAIRPAPTPIRRGRPGADTSNPATKRTGIAAPSPEDFNPPTEDTRNFVREAPVTPEQMAALEGQTPFMGSKTQQANPDALAGVLKRFYGRVIDDNLLMEILNSMR